MYFMILVVCDDLVFGDVLDCLGRLDVVLLFSDADLDIFDVDLSCPAESLMAYDVLDGDHLVDVSLGGAHVDLVDLAVIDLDEVAVVYLLDVLVDVLGLHSHCRCQLAYCRCSCSLSLYDGLPDVDANVESHSSSV